MSKAKGKNSVHKKLTKEEIAQKDMATSKRFLAHHGVFGGKMCQLHSWGKVQPLLEGAALVSEYGAMKSVVGTYRVHTWFEYQRTYKCADGTDLIIDY